MRIESNLPNAPIGNAPNSTVALSRPGFSKALEQAQQPATSGVRSIKPGDTLTSIVREQAQINGVKLTPSEEFRWTQALAADSGIQNANAIFPGQKIQMQNMLNQWASWKKSTPRLCTKLKHCQKHISRQNQRIFSDHCRHGSSANHQLTKAQLHQCSGSSCFEQNIGQGCGPRLYSQS